MDKSGSQKKLACIIPARNESAAILITLQCLAQELTNLSSAEEFEFIIIDDASETPIQAKFSELRGSSFANISLRIERSDTRLGSAKARNLGASLSSANYYLFLDAHICFSPGSISHLLTFLDTHTETIIGASFADCGTECELQNFARPCSHSPYTFYFGWNIKLEPEPELHPNYQCPSSEPFFVPIVGAASLCISRLLFNKLGCFENELSGSGNLEDSELCMRAWRLGYSVFVHPKAKCLHLNPPEKQALKQASSENPLSIPWYKDCEENIFRFSYLILPETVHHQHFSEARNGKEFLGRLYTKKLLESRARISAMQIFSPEESLLFLLNLPRPRDSHYFRGIFAPDIQHALRSRFEKESLLFVDRSDTYEALFVRGLTNIYDLTAKKPSQFEKLYDSYRNFILPNHSIAPNWEDLILYDVAVQYLSPVYLLIDSLAQGMKEKHLRSLSTPCTKSLSQTIVARAEQIAQEDL